MYSRKRLSGLYTAMFGLGASLLVLAAGPALAAGKTFKPATGWSVTHMQGRSGGSAYCTLARRFEGNTVVTFARNTNGEGTIAVDFQQPLFSPEQTYRIGLQAGNGITREFLTRPATPNALVLRTGQDSQFFSALAGANELGVILDNARYAFAMADFKSGQAQLNGCIGVTPVASAPTKSNVAPARPVLAQESAAIRQLRTELESLKRENEGIVASLKQPTTQNVEPADLSSSVENNALMARLSALESEKNTLVEKLQAERTSQSLAAQDEQALKLALEGQKELKKTLEAERAQRASLESALQQKTAEAEKRGELRARIEQLESSNTELKTLRTSLEAERNKRLEIERELQAQRATSAASLEDQERLRSRVAELESQNKTLQASTSKMGAEQARREAAESALKELQMTATAREKKIGDLLEQMSQERQKLAAADAAKEAELSSQHAAEIAKLNTQIQDLRAQSARQAELERSMSAEQARREAAEEALRQMQLTVSEREAKIADLKRSMQREKTKLAAADAAKQAELSAQHTAEIAKLNVQIEDLQAQTARQKELERSMSAEQARRQAAEEALQKMQSDASARDAEIAALKRSMEQEKAKLAAADAAKEAELSAQHSAEIAKLNNRIQHLKAQSERQHDLELGLDSEKARRQAAEATVRQMQLTVSEREAKIAELKKDMAAERQKLAASEAAKQAELSQKHAAEIASLNAQLQDLQALEAKTGKLAKTVDAEKAAREAAEQEISLLRNALGEKQIALSQMMADLQKEREQTAKARAAAADTSRLKVLNERLSALEARNTELIADLQAARAQTQATQNAAAALTKDKQVLDKLSKEQIATKAAEMNELKSLLDTEKARREQIEKIAASKASDDAKLADIQASMSTLEARNAALEKALSAEKAKAAIAETERAENLRKQLDVMKRDNEALALRLAAATQAPKTPDNTAEIEAIRAKAAADRNELKALLEAESARRQKLEAAMAQPAAVKDDSQMSARLAELQKRNADLEAKLAALPKGAGANTQILAETKSSLATALAERDEYRTLLQRERARKASGANANMADVAALNKHINALETERADLVRKLAFTEASGKLPATDPAIDKRLSDLQVQKTALQKQLDIAQRDIIAARKAGKASDVSDTDMRELVAENKRLQAQLRAGPKTSEAALQDLQTEIAALRAQNSVLTSEMGKRLATAPDRAQMDNALAAADFKAREAEKRQQSMKARFDAVEAENIRLAKEMARLRGAAAGAPKRSQADKDAQINETRIAALSAENKRLATILQRAGTAGASLPLPAAPAQVSAPAPQAMQAPAAMAPAKQTASYAPQGPTGKEISEFLHRAGIQMATRMEKIASVSTPSFSAFRWDTGSVFGTGEQRRMPKTGFEQAVNNYLAKTRSRCSGTFDESFDPSQVAGGQKPLAVADVACVMPNGTGAGAAVVFFYKDGLFNVIAHEGDINAFDKAMSTRDTLVRLMKTAL